MQGQRLVQLYRAAGFASLAEFARRVGIKEVTAQKHIQRDRIPRDAAVAYIQAASSTGADLDWLLTGHGTPPQNTLQSNGIDRRLSEVAQSSPADLRRVPSVGWNQPDLPIRATIETSGGLMLTASVIDRAPRPGYISPHIEAYALYMPTDDMAPRYERGDRLLINPALPIVEGKDVILLSAADDQGRQKMLIRRLLHINDKTYSVMSHNPRRTIDVARADWPIIHRVEGARGR